MRYFLYIAYDGTDFLGWQSQPEGRTVQGELEQRLSTMLRRPISITGAGRTDAGVHASQMVCHLNLDLSQGEMEQVTYRLRRFLPPDIALLEVRRVTEDAHARFDAVSRRYGYHVRTEASPFTRKYCTLIPETLDFEVMNEAASHLIGEHDFTTFSKKHSQVKTHICTVTEAKWERCSSCDECSYTFHIAANRFLRNMVRGIVGTLFEVGRGKIEPSDFGDLLTARDRSLCGSSAPSEGLFLEEVTYPASIFELDQ
ncbi:MAG: tRNA pseudouridine(38-40) synthase TruA [Porphyromonas sp.]|uniref:tRNA pseudouridine(38-40) synthase TruA n=1 Tax=Porphyromonas sp. TaxID=1924944 RepID=UPI002A9086EA|nr:tRNA pseudouridine(38-40) synthase TruA [Porphyromonas sp.]MDD7468292.1 tRNA pseudouridine(38-40) synthase TruA [Bacteroidales bacterium]MDY6102844.1 tRNA pseudouridine(38-40) synthase TruA [Porphyromonas sp.]